MTGFPKVSCYSAHRGSGAPYVRADGSHNDAMIRALARYSTVTMMITPWYSVREASRADVLLRLREMNPRIRILGYTLLGWWYLPQTFTVSASDKSFAGSWHDAIKSTGGFGEANGTGWWVKWENPATESALTNLLCGSASSRLFDGHFYDFLSPDDSAGASAMQRMIAKVKAAGGPGFTVHGNGWGADDLDTDGSFREGFPSLLGHDFEHVRQWRAGRPHRTEDWLQAGSGVTSFDTEDAKRQARFAHGTACLFDMQCSFGPDRDAPYLYPQMWLPEYDGGGIGAGWLGEPASEPLASGGLWRRVFSGGMVVVNEGSVSVTTNLPRGLCRLSDGAEMGSVTVPAMDCVMLWRAR